MNEFVNHHTTPHIAPHASAPTNLMATDHMDLSDLLSTIRYQKKWIFLVLLLGALLTMFAVSMIETKYTSQSSVLLNPETEQSQGQTIKNLAKSVTLDIGFVLTEIEILKSRGLIQMVVDKLNLSNDPEFNTDLDKKPDAMGNVVTKNNAAFKQTLAHDKIDFYIREKKENTKIINEVLDAITITPVVGSSVVRIKVTSHSPEKSAMINNALIQEYMKKRQAEKTKTRNKFSRWLENTINVLQQEISKKEKNAEDYRARENLNLGDKSLFSTQEISMLHKQRSGVEQDLSNIKSQIAQIENLDDTVIANLANSSLLRSLKAQQVEMESNISELSSRYGPKHPTMIEKQAELSEVRKSIRRQKTIAQNELRSRMNALKGTISDIKKRIRFAEKDNNAENNALIKFQEMKLEIESAQKSLRDLQDKYADAMNASTISTESARVISYATIPETPSTPNQKLLSLLGFIVSSFMAFLIAFLNEKFSNKFRTPESLEKEFYIPCLADIPKASMGWKKNIIKHCLSKPNSPVIEVIRNLNVTIKNYRTKEGEQPKVVLLTSSIKNEGKTSTAYLMALTAAKSGERTILIEANLKNPILQDVTGSNKRENLVHILTNQKDLTQVVEKDEKSGLHVIYGGAIPHNSYNLLNSQKMKNLLMGLKENYDLVIIDSPSCKQAADARLLERLADLCLYCVKYNRTAKNVIKNTIKSFTGREGSDTAFILTHSR
jgi:capsular exopolysaccharide synthesis family protein